MEKKRKKILIYDDIGCACTFDLVRVLGDYFGPKGIVVEPVKADDIIKKNALNEEVLVFFMPGGAATPYLQKLKTPGNQKIRDYVAQGGVYFGICAGAYYACREICFEQDVPELALNQKCGLDLVEAVAEGTLKNDFGLPSYYKPTAANAVITKVRWLDDGEEHGVLYHGGPKFEQVKDAEILAVYEEAEGNPPAILARRYGQGLVIVSGVHFEDDVISMKAMVRQGLPFQEHAKTNLQNIKKYDVSRQRLTAKLMAKFQRF